MASRYPAPEPTTAVQEIAESWKAAAMRIRAMQQGGVCAIPRCDRPSVVLIGTIDGDWPLCMAHEMAARDLAEGRNPFKR